MPSELPPPDLLDAILVAVVRRIDRRHVCAERVPLASVRAGLAALGPVLFNVALFDAERRGALVLVAVEGDDIQPEDTIVVPGRGVLAWVEVAWVEVAPGRHPS